MFFKLTRPFDPSIFERNVPRGVIIMPDSTLFKEEARRACAANNRCFMEAATVGDAVSVAELYCEDAVLLPDGRDMIHGRAGIEAYWKTSFGRGIKDIVLTTVDFSGEGDFRHEIGRVDITIEPEGRDSAILFGKYVVVWKRTIDGAWKLLFDIWNLNHTQ